VASWWLEFLKVPTPPLVQLSLVLYTSDQVHHFPEAVHPLHIQLSAVIGVGLDAGEFVVIVPHFHNGPFLVPTIIPNLYRSVNIYL
jgi:hypothetical protein